MSIARVDVKIQLLGGFRILTVNGAPRMAERAILHIDMDAFYASVEMLDNPALRGLPVIVGGTPEGRGVVAAASYEARKFGVHSAMSAFQAVRLCPHGVFIKPRMSRYGEVSRSIFKIFHDYTPLVEAISVDEAFLDVTGCQRLFGPPEAIGRAIKRRIREEIGLTASVGVAPNKFLAKLASDLEKPDGFVVIPAERAEAMLAPLGVEKIWGVGKVTRERLALLGVTKIGDLKSLPAEALERHLGSYARTLLDLARGIDHRPVEPGGDSKSIGAETTFARDIGEAAELRRQLIALADEVAKRLRDEGLCARTVNLKARYPDFTTVTRALTLPSPTALTQEIRQAAITLLEQRLGRAGRPLRLIGVSVSNLERPGEGQGELFVDESRVKSEKLDRLLDAMQDRFGESKIRRGHG